MRRHVHARTARRRPGAIGLFPLMTVRCDDIDAAKMRSILQEREHQASPRSTPLS